jgi:hypothetical protein
VILGLCIGHRVTKDVVCTRFLLFFVVVSGIQLLLLNSVSTLCTVTGFYDMFNKMLHTKQSILRRRYDTFYVQVAR